MCTFTRTSATYTQYGVFLNWIQWLSFPELLLRFVRIVFAQKEGIQFPRIAWQIWFYNQSVAVQFIVSHYNVDPSCIVELSTREYFRIAVALTNMWREKCDELSGERNVLVLRFSQNINVWVPKRANSVFAVLWFYRPLRLLLHASSVTMWLVIVFVLFGWQRAGGGVWLDVLTFFIFWLGGKVGGVLGTVPIASHYNFGGDSLKWTFNIITYCTAYLVC